VTSSILIALVHASVMGSGGGTYSEAYEQTIKTGKPLVVLVCAQWCQPCQQMKKNVLPEVRKRGWMNKVSFATIDWDQNSDLAQELTGGGSIPRLVMYCKTPEGWQRSELVGSQSVGAVEQFLSGGIAAGKVAAEKASETEAVTVATEVRR